MSAAVKDDRSSPPGGRARRLWGKVWPPSWRRLALATGFLALAAGSYGMVRVWARPADKPQTGVQYHWDEAQRALEADDLALARTHLRHCLEICPANAEAHFLLARLGRRADDPAECQSHLGKARALQWPKEEIDLERTLLQAQSGNARRVEKKLIEQLKSFGTDRGLILEALVKGYLEIYSFRDVEIWATQWLTSFPADWRPWYYRGRAYQLTQRFDHAIADYRRALEHKPGHGPARLGLASSLMINGQFAEALAQFQSYLDAHADDPGALMGVANCQASLGEPEAARSALDRLAGLGQESAGALLVRARLEMADGAPAAAWTLLKRAEALAPSEPDITQGLILALRQLGKNPEADEYERKLHAVYAQYAELQALQRKVLREPDNPALRHEVGVFFLKLGREEEAGRWLHSVLRLDPEHQATHRVLAEYFAKQGDGRRAAFHRRKAGGAEKAGGAAP
jgi:Tfp pilus assembly protein PilF